jgi:hypothetical protein
LVDEANGNGRYVKVVEVWCLWQKKIPLIDEAHVCVCVCVCAYVDRDEAHGNGRYDMCVCGCVCAKKNPIFAHTKIPFLIDEAHGNGRYAKVVEVWCLWFHLYFFILF